MRKRIYKFNKKEERKERKREEIDNKEKEKRKERRGGGEWVENGETTCLYGPGPKPDQFAALLGNDHSH